MYWKNFSKIVVTFALPLLIPSVGLAFGFPFALLTGVIFAVLALSRGHRHLADAWLSTLVSDLCVVAAYCATLGVGRMGIIGVAAMWSTFAIPSLVAATICWLVANRWIVIVPE